MYMFISLYIHICILSVPGTLLAFLYHFQGPVACMYIQTHTIYINISIQQCIGLMEILSFNSFMVSATVFHFLLSNSACPACLVFFFPSLQIMLNPEFFFFLFHP